MNSDVRDILELETVTQKDGPFKEKKKLKRLIEPIKRPVGVNREVWGLIRKDDCDQPPLIPTSEPKLYQQPKAKLRYGVRKWKWVPFKNPARVDNAQFYHWRCLSDIENSDYAFAKFNKKTEIQTYTENEYIQHLEDENWTKLETDYLIDLCKKYDLRFYIIHDRWNINEYKNRTIDELKDRYYKVIGTLNKLKDPNSDLFIFDLEHEHKRREQLEKLFNRTKEQIDEEQYLLDELKKIELRKKERERKSQDVNKLLHSIADIDANQSNVNTNVNNKLLNNSGSVSSLCTTVNTQKRIKQRKSSTQLSENAISLPTTPTASSSMSSIETMKDQNQKAMKKSLIFKAVVESAGIKFPDSKTAGVSLRSYKMKLPPSVGLKKTKAIEQLLEKLQIEHRPIATETICEQFNDLRSDMVLLYELNQALSNCEFEVQTLRHRYEAINPIKTTNEASSTETSPSLSITPQSIIDTTSKRISDIFDVSVTPTGTLERRRKAALNQTNILKKLRGRSAGNS